MKTFCHRGHISLLLDIIFHTVSIFRDRLSASDMIQVRKVIEHVYEKVLGQGSETGSQTGNGSGDKAEKEKSSDSAMTEEKVELLCNDQVCVV